MTLPKPPRALVAVLDEVAELLLPQPEETCTDAEIRRAALALRQSGPVGRAAAKHPEFVRRYAARTRTAGDDETRTLDRAVDELRGLRHALDESSVQIRALGVLRSKSDT